MVFVRISTSLQCHLLELQVPAGHLTAMLTLCLSSQTTSARCRLTDVQCVWGRGCSGVGNPLPLMGPQGLPS